jgi:hypothetical protein
MNTDSPLDHPVDFDVFHQKFGNPVPDNVKALIMFPLLVTMIIARDKIIPLSMLVVPIAYLLFFFRSGIYVDLTRMRYKKYRGPFPLKIGFWKDFMTPESIIIRHVVERSGGSFMTSTMSVGSSSLKTEAFLAFVESDNMIRIVSNRKEEKAVSQSKQIARKLNIDWINEREGV